MTFLIYQKETITLEKKPLFTRKFEESVFFFKNFLMKNKSQINTV